MMKLRFSPTSPYVRKVLLTAIEAGVGERVEKVATDVWAPATDIARDNPLGKVPALVLDDGQVLFDSRVICEYLDSLNAGAALFPPGGPARWSALRLQALADGICDAAVGRLLEERRPAAQQSASWVERQRAAISRALDVLEAAVDDLTGPVTIGTLAVIAALGYLDLRFAADHWREGRPRLTEWFQVASDRESFRLTAPPV